MEEPTSSFITRRELKIIEKAFHRRRQHYKEHVKRMGSLCTDANLSAPTDRITDTFISQSRHFHPKVLEQPDSSFLHRYEYDILKDDLNNCKGRQTLLVFSDTNKATEISWRQYWTMYNTDPINLNRYYILVRFRFLTLHDFLEMSSELAKTLKGMDPHRRLIYIVSLLVHFHYGDQCETYMSVAIKLCLKALQLGVCSLKRGPYWAAMRLQYYCKLIHRYKLNNKLVATAFKVFHWSTEVNYTFLRKVLTLKYTLRALQETGLKANLFNDVRPRVPKIVDRCLFFGNEKFVELVEFGAANHYSEKDWYSLEREISISEESFSPDRQSTEQRFVEQIDELSLIQEFGPSSVSQQIHPLAMLRSIQIFCLFLWSRGDENCRRQAEYTLKVLWASIPDPLQTQEKIARCMHASKRLASVIELLLVPLASENGQPIQDELRLFSNKFKLLAKVLSRFYDRSGVIREACQWYKAIVLRDASLFYSPRSLKHLSRCAIRQRLGTNFQLPDGARKLNLDFRLRAYLLLKECGQNPFEGERHLKKKLKDLYPVPL